MGNAYKEKHDTTIPGSVHSKFISSDGTTTKFRATSIASFSSHQRVEAAAPIGKQACAACWLVACEVPYNVVLKESFLRMSRFVPLRQLTTEATRVFLLGVGHSSHGLRLVANGN